MLEQSIDGNAQFRKNIQNCEIFMRSSVDFIRQTAKIIHRGRYFMHYEELGIALTQFVEVSLTGDADRTASYARHLSKCLRHIGDDETANQIDTLINSHQTTLARTARKGPDSPIPVDSESRLTIADERIVGEPVGAVLSAKAGAIVERFLESIRQAQNLLNKGVAVPRSMLLYGPPGCGKTLTAYHIAHSLSLPVVTARSDGLVSSYLGSTAKNIRSLFDYAMKRECVLLLDEFDAIAKMRDDRHELGELKRVVISLLQNIDASKDSLIFVAATNHSHLLDPAVWRRFSYAIEIAVPDTDARKILLRRFFQSRIADDAVEYLATLTDGMSGADLKRFADDTLRDMLLGGRSSVAFPDAISLLCERHFSANSEKKQFSTDDAIRLIRNVHGKSASQNKLGELFGKSQSQISRTLTKDTQKNGRGKQPAASN